VLANHERWKRLSGDEYQDAKRAAAAQAADAVGHHLPGWSEHVVFQDVFTPVTIERFTSHAGGAVYGSPAKRWDGETGIGGLVLIGSDQGYLGIVGALISGVVMANRHVLHRFARGEAAPA
jgi:phytoene dehydrogenase-like protein